MYEKERLNILIEGLGAVFCIVNLIIILTENT